MPQRMARGAHSVVGARRIAAATLLVALATGGAPAHAAGLDPLPAAAKALTGVTSYQVVVTPSFSGAPRPRATPRPGATPPPGARRGPRNGFFGFGRGTRTIVAVRKGGQFEDYIVIRGADRSGKTTTTSLIIYGNKVCTEAAGAKSYTCQTSTNGFSLDPTAAFAAGAGSTAFTHAASKTIGGQSCAGYAYLNQSSTLTAKGVVYIAAKTNLPCEQDATQIRRAPTGSGTFTQTTVSVWSRFNDKSLTVPSVPS